MRVFHKLLRRLRQRITSRVRVIRETNFPFVSMLSWITPLGRFQLRRVSWLCAKCTTPKVTERSTLSMEDWFARKNSSICLKVEGSRWGQTRNSRSSSRVKFRIWSLKGTKDSCKSWKKCQARSNLTKNLKKCTKLCKKANLKRSLLNRSSRRSRKNLTPF